jgi:hypothetical protein
VAEATGTDVTRALDALGSSSIPYRTFDDDPSKAALTTEELEVATAFPLLASALPETAGAGQVASGPPAVEPPVAPLPIAAGAPRPPARANQARPTYAVLTHAVSRPAVKVSRQNATEMRVSGQCLAATPLTAVFRTLLGEARASAVAGNSGQGLRELFRRL